MATQAFLLHAISPLHAGTGQAVGIIDLPIAREKATGIPFLPGSSIKGVLRDLYDPTGANRSEFLAAFGPDTANAADHAGALAFGEARLLLLPVRSLVGTFAWVTSPMLLRLARRDIPALPDVGVTGNLPTAKLSSTSVLRHGQGQATRMFLEDIDLTIAPGNGQDVDALGAHLSSRLWDVPPPAGAPFFMERLCVVDDETMTFLWETATQIDARNRLNDQGTVAKGALWYEESLPAETVLAGAVTATDSRSNHRATAQHLLSTFVKRQEGLQFGGKANVGRGRARFRCA
jgi:CRISPR-associated protein Cmr4